MPTNTHHRLSPDQGTLDERLDDADGSANQPAPPNTPTCNHRRKVEKHFTYGYRWHCPDCKAGGEDWWD